MNSLADTFHLKLGDTEVVGRRLTINEIREHHASFLDGQFGSIDKCIEIIRDHVKRVDGKAFNPYDLTPGQVRTLIGELVLPDGGRGISDFIGLLSV